MKKQFKIAIAIVVVQIIFSFIILPYLPDMMATSFSADNGVRQYSPKLQGTLLMPIISLLCLALFMVIPKIDPLKKNYQKFMKYYDAFILLFIIFMAYMQVVISLYNLGFGIDVSLMMLSATGFLMFYLGTIMPKLKRNWFIGIRTPWTISDDKVWEKTHIFGGKLFKICGIVIVLGILFPGHMTLFILMPVIVMTLGVFVYSYVQWKNLNK